MNNNEFKLFAILSEPRTGSTVISNKLGLLDGVHCQGEIFHPEKIYCSIQEDSIPNKDKRNKHPVEFLHKVMEQTYQQKNQPKLIGFKLFFDHNPLITQYIIDSKIPTILLERTNKLAQYSSLKIAKKTGKWHSKQILTDAQITHNQQQGNKIKFSLIEFVGFTIRSHFRFHNLIKKLKDNNVPHYYIEYEKMFRSEQWKNLVEFLNIGTVDIDVKETLEKQNKGNLLDRFSNSNYASNILKLILQLPLIPRLLNISSEGLFGQSKP